MAFLINAIILFNSQHKLEKVSIKIINKNEPLTNCEYCDNLVKRVVGN